MEDASGGHCVRPHPQPGPIFYYPNLTFINRGISGNKATDLEKHWQQDTIDLKPDGLSILIGVNDNGNVPLEQYEQVYDKILIAAEAANPKIHLVLCEPFCLSVGRVKEQWETFSKGIREEQEVVALLARKHHAALVKFQHAFDTACKRAPADHWIWDGIHPTYSGHQHDETDRHEPDSRSLRQLNKPMVPGVRGFTCKACLTL